MVEPGRLGARQGRVPVPHSTAPITLGGCPRGVAGMGPGLTRWWRGWRCLGERERRRRGLGVEDGYGRRGEREWWWRGLGVEDG